MIAEYNNWLFFRNDAAFLIGIASNYILPLIYDRERTRSFVLRFRDAELAG